MQYPTGNVVGAALHYATFTTLGQTLDARVLHGQTANNNNIYMAQQPTTNT